MAGFQERIPSAGDLEAAAATLEEGPTIETAHRQALLRTTLTISLGALIAVGILSIVGAAVGGLTSRVGPYDFRYYYIWSWALRQNLHANIYDPTVMRAAAAQLHVYTNENLTPYPVVLPLLMLPLAWLPFTAAARVWLIINLALWLAAAALLANWVRTAIPSLRDARGTAQQLAARRFILLVVFVLPLIYAPIIQGIGLGQTSLLTLVLLLLVAWLDQRGHPVAAGAVLALPVWIKLYPVVLVAYFVLRGNRRLVVSFLATAAGSVVLLWAILGLPTLSAMRAVLVAGGGLTTSYQNEAFSRTPFWLAIAAGARQAQVASLTGVLGYALMAVVVVAFGAGMFIIQRRSNSLGPATAVGPEAALRNALGFAWALTTMVLVVPVTWEHYDAWLLPAFGIAFACSMITLMNAPSGNARRVLRRALPLVGVILAYALTMSDLPFAYDGDPAFHVGPFIAGHPLRPLFMLVRPAATLILWAILAYLLKHSWRTVPATTGRAESAMAEWIQTGAVEVSTSRLMGMLVGLLFASILVRTVWLILQLKLGIPPGAVQPPPPMPTG